MCAPYHPTRMIKTLILRVQRQILVWGLRVGESRSKLSHISINVNTAQKSLLSGQIWGTIYQFTVMKSPSHVTIAKEDSDKKVIWLTTKAIYIRSKCRWSCWMTFTISKVHLTSNFTQKNHLQKHQNWVSIFKFMVIP